jgi:TetR/AcrR family transcriptional regulator, transcriptional repressor for nem operon
MARRAAARPVVRERLLDAARQHILDAGFAAAGVAEICAAAGVTKGSFFHYFESKDALGLAALERFGADLGVAFGAAPFQAELDPIARVDGYIDFTIEICHSSVLRRGCLVGMLAQELATTDPSIRGRCDAIFSGWADSFAAELAAARTAYASNAAFDPHSVATHFIAIVEGALILAKASANPTFVDAQLEHFRSYVWCLLGQQASSQEGV